ncbi:MAG: molybdopterin molybdotransferase MoeA [Planctomycetes bacterium]|nr:molybdopterin molybdotransferase MoeA [Planctomycetota bacterium]
MATISLATALQRVLTIPCPRTPTLTLPLDQAHGHTLAAGICSDTPWPQTDRSAMDGFAIVAAPELPPGSQHQVIGRSLAGHPFTGTVARGQAVQIMTGAVVPEGADAVIPVEQTTGFDQPTVTIQTAARPGMNIRPRGSELRQGQQVLHEGQRLRAAEIGALAVLGIAEVPVFLRPRVAILATGDEVVPVDSAPAPHLVRESNSWALAAQVRECGAEPHRLGVARDERDHLLPLLQHGLDGADVLLTIGGISKGTHDLVHVLLQELGVEAEFHGIELKPGKPTFFGVRRRAGARETFVFGLPGNPASCFTVFDLLVAPLLERMVGREPPPWAAQAALRGAFKPNSRLQATPARVAIDAEGTAIAELLPPSPSGDPFSLLAANGYSLLPPNSKAGELARAVIVPYADGLRGS